VCVTVASGKAGQAGRGRPAGAGHDVRASDLLAPGEDIGIRLVPADLTDHGQAMTLGTKGRTMTVCGRSTPG
jgi:hypothetical protein